MQGALVDAAERVFVGGLPYYLSEEQCRELLGSFGAIKSFDLVKDRETGNSKGYGLHTSTCLLVLIDLPQVLFQFNLYIMRAWMALLNYYLHVLRSTPADVIRIRCCGKYCNGQVCRTQLQELALTLFHSIEGHC